MKPSFIPLFLLLVNTFPTFCFAQAGQDTTILQHELASSERRMFDALTTGDKASVEQLFSTDYLTINADGVMQTREEALSTFGKFKGSTYSLSDRKIRLYSHEAVINGKAKFYVKSILVAEVWYTEIWIFHDRWQLAGWQGTMTGLPSWYPVLVTLIFILMSFLIVVLLRRSRNKKMTRIQR